MVTMMVCIPGRREAESFGKLSRELFAYLSEEEFKLHCFFTLQETWKFLETGALLDMACIGVTGQEEIKLLRQIRKQYAKVQLLLVADASVSPMEYLTPDVRAASLLLHPYEAKQKERVVRGFLKSCLEEHAQDGGSGNDKDVLVLENREGRTVIPYRQIYYIEVRERRIFIRIQNQEYSRYDSMEHMLGQLPDIFVRCHRSFAFNMQHLERVRLSENTVYLEHGMAVPLSRSYKSAVKECMHGRYAAGRHDAGMPG